MMSEQTESLLFRFRVGWFCEDVSLLEIKWHTDLCNVWVYRSLTPSIKQNNEGLDSSYWPIVIVYCVQAKRCWTTAKVAQNKIVKREKLALLFLWVAGSSTVPLFVRKRKIPIPLGCIELKQIDIFAQLVSKVTRKHWPSFSKKLKSNFKSLHQEIKKAQLKVPTSVLRFLLTWVLHKHNMYDRILLVNQFSRKICKNLTILFFQNSSKLSLHKASA